jgi:polar amino acid transport system substrate-binding protein
MGNGTHGLARLAVIGVIGAIATTACGGGATDDLLAKVKAADKIVMSTDPEYPPQSSLADDGSYEGFDIDVGTEIAKRLGVAIAFETPSWEAITAGSWSGRWDFSVGSMTITTDREKVIAFTSPYYYTPAQMAVLPDSGITSLDGLAGKVICVGEGTTYLQWLDGTLDFGTATPQTKPPAGATATTLKSDRNCAESWQAGRRDFDGWLSSVTTVQGAIDEGLPVMKLGDPVYNEPLAVAFDKGGPSPTTMVTEVNKILDAMRSDGTLKSLSEKWFGEDLTTKVGG